MKDLHDSQTIDIDSVGHDQYDQVKKQDGDFSKRLQEGLVIIDVQTSGRDGEKTLANSKTLVDGRQVDSKICRNNRFEWFPKGELQFKNTFETKARRAIAARGVRYGRVTAVPVDEVDVLLAELEGIKAGFYKEVAERSSRYDTIIEEHKKAFPDDADIIESLKTPKEDFFRRFQFTILPPMVFKPYFAEDEEVAVNTIIEGILDTVVDQANVVYEKIIGKPSMIQRTFKPIRALRDYVFSMSFKHTQLDGLVEQLDESFDNLPRTGTIADGDMVYAVKLVKNLTERSKLLTDILPVMEDEASAQQEPEVLDSIKNTVVVSESEAPDSYTPVEAEVSNTGFYW